MCMTQLFLLLPQKAGVIGVLRNAPVKLTLSVNFYGH